MNYRRAINVRPLFQHSEAEDVSQDNPGIPPEPPLDLPQGPVTEESEEEVMFRFASSPGRDTSSISQGLPASFDSQASFRPHTQDLFPEVVLQEGRSSSPIASPLHVSSM